MYNLEMNTQTKRTKSIAVEIPPGTRIGKWTVISRMTLQRKDRQRLFWLCRCDCGYEDRVETYSLRTGDSKQCRKCKLNVLRSPSSNKKRSETFLKKYPDGISAFNKVYGRYKRQAKDRNLSFNLSKDEFRSIITLKCHYCGVSDSTTEYPFNIKYGTFKYTGIDRKDNTIGYELDNCLPCCTICNLSKRDLSYDDFITWINKLIKNFEDKNG